MEIPTDWTGGMPCALQAALRLSNVAFPAHLDQRADGSLPGIRNRRLHSRVEMR
jgi:hypothetical protein